MYKVPQMKVALIVSLLFFVSIVPMSSDVSGGIIVVDQNGGGDYEIIQNAVDEAEPGDKLIIRGGVYQEEVSIDKSLRIEGESLNAVITAPSGIAVDILERDVKITNLTIRDSNLGVRIKANRTEINDCYISNCSRGVFLYQTDGTELIDCSIDGGTEGILSQDDSRTFIQNVSINSTLENNLRSVGSIDAHVKNCSFSKAGYHPAYLSRSEGVKVTNCTFSENERGMYLYNSSKIVMDNNSLDKGINIEGKDMTHWSSHQIDNNPIQNGELIYRTHKSGENVMDHSGQVILVNCTKMNVAGCDLNNGEVGLIAAFSEDNRFVGNNMMNNHQGIRSYSSYENVFHHNAFINNTIQVASEDNSSFSNSWTDGLGDGNYWSDYEGADDGSGSRLSGDGVGDTLLAHPSVDHGSGYYQLDPEPLMDIPDRQVKYHNVSGPGWRFLSTGVVLDMSMDEVLKDIEGSYDKVMWFDGRWKSFSPYRAERFNDEPDLRRNMGFWIHFSEPVNLSMNGFSCARTKHVLNEGWNMVGVSSGAAFNTSTTGLSFQKIGFFNHSREYMLEYIEEDLSMHGGNGYMVDCGAEEQTWIQVWKDR